MFKTISAALLAVSVLAAPALATGSSKTAQAPAVKTGTVKAATVKPAVLKANAKMGHHSRHFRHHLSHKKMNALKTHQASKVVIKHTAPATKRG
jgi:hypothetical protein